MTTLLFVHGTGVRCAAYNASLATVKAQAALHLPRVQVQGCLWGDLLGARLHDDGASVPSYELGQSLAAQQGRDSGREQAVRWRLLYEDPLYELRSYAALALSSEGLGGSNRSPLAKSPAQLALGQLRVLSFADAALQRSGHLTAGLVQKAVAWLEADASFAPAADSETLADPARGRAVIARAFVAAWAVAAEREMLPVLDGDLRDRLYQNVVAGLGGATKGLKDEFIGALGGLASRLATPVLRARRTAVTDGSIAATNDILLYQTRHGGEAIRSFIAQRIRACTPPVYVLAHSLGGIACVELLVLANDLNVAGLVTCGSQAPYLYESDALGALRWKTPLPGHFPKKWLNVFDLNDMLSYVGAGVFPGRVTDHEVQSRQPFPHSHSAYWTNEQLWTRLKDFTA